MDLRKGLRLRYGLRLGLQLAFEIRVQLGLRFHFVHLSRKRRGIEREK